jgi:hypothetical protein
MAAKKNTDTGTGTEDRVTQLEAQVAQYEKQLVDMDRALTAEGKTVGYVLGQKYLVRTVTHYYTGKLVALSSTEMVLGEAAWIPDTGRFHDCLEKGQLGEIEPYPDAVIVNRGAVVDASVWKHDLPRKQK